MLDWNISDFVTVSFMILPLSVPEAAHATENEWAESNVSTAPIFISANYDFFSGCNWVECDKIKEGQQTHCTNKNEKCVSCPALTDATRE